MVAPAPSRNVADAAPTSDRMRRPCTDSHILDQIRPYLYLRPVADRTRKVTVNLPRDLLEGAVKLTGKGITPTIVEGLQEIQKRSKRSALRALRGKVRFELDLEETRR